MFSNLPDPLVASSHRSLGAGGCRSSWELAPMAVWALQDGGRGKGVCRTFTYYILCLKYLFKDNSIPVDENEEFCCVYR